MTPKTLSRILVAIAAVTALPGCMEEIGLASAPPKVASIVVGDEPYAVKAGAAILANGGNAVDAATAMYFAMSVTYPVAAGLGGGGICVVHDAVSGKNEEFDFLAHDAAGGGPFAVPGNIRGFASIQTAYGVLPLQRVISAAERYAAAGFPISEALAKRLAASENVVRLDAGLAAEFLDESGHVKPAGSIVASRELADTLSAIRTGGVDAFYAGTIAQNVVSYSSAQSGAITASELAAYSVSGDSADVIHYRDQYIYLPSRHTGAGAFAGTLLNSLLHSAGSTNPESNTEAAVVDAAKQTLSKYNVANLPNDLGATGFAAMDNSGQAIACAVTMNGPFGSGHTAQGTGVTLAKSPSSSQAGLAVAFLTPVIATSADGHVSLVAAGAGGPIGTASIADALARLSKSEIVTRRDRRGGSDLALYDTMNAILCQDQMCSALLDAGANGLGAAPGR